MILIQMLKFDVTVKKKNEIQKLHLSFEIRLKQRSKFEFYFLFFGKLKTEEQVRFTVSLGDMTDQRSVWAQNFVKKRTEILFQFLLKIEIEFEIRFSI